MANIRQYSHNKEAKSLIVEDKQEATTLNKLCSDISTYFEEAIKIISNDGERKVSVAIKTQLQILLQHQSPQSCAMFLQGLANIDNQDTSISSYTDRTHVLFEKPETREFILRWSNLLQKLQEHYPKLAKRVHDLFLKNYSWNDLNSELFFNLIESLMKLKGTPEKKRIRSWFNKYFQLISSKRSKSYLEKAILKFNQFLAICDKYHVYSSLAKPPKKVISFQLKEDDYIEKCNYALEQSETADEKSREHISHRQAELLDQLPESRLIKQAFAKGLNVVCDKMVLLDTIHIPSSKEALDINVNYNRYRSQALVFLAAKNLSITKPLHFFKLLDKIPEKKLSTSEKLILSKGLVNCYLSDNKLDEKNFITYSIEFKNTFGSSYLEKIFDNSNNQMSCEDYLITCQFLIDLKDNIDIDNLLSKHLPNIKNLNKELETIKLELVRKKFPEDKLESVLENFRTKCDLVKFPLSATEVKQLGEDYQAVLEYGKIFQKLPLSELSAAARKAGRSLKENRHDRKASLELVSIIREIVNRVFHINPHNTQILALLALINVPPGKKGRIGQIKTGEGKSLIDAMLAAYMGCQDKFIDIITSSPNLAIRDQKKYAKFFNTFGISSSHICHRRPEKSHFNGQILYGTNRDFEFSILRDELYNRRHRYTVLNGKLCKRICDVAIVDEVDNLFIDTALSSARIATSSPESRSWIYAPILAFVKNQIEAKDNISIDPLSQIRHILKDAYNGKYADIVDQIPDKKILQWISSAKSALEDKKPNRDYVILPKKKPNGEEENDKRQIVIVDYKNTGRLYPSTRWQHGLHEFIETKEGIEPQSESLTSASMSHPAFFNSYNEIYGLSGTVGEEVERKEIETIYNLDTFDVPPHCRSQRYLLSPELLASEEKQFDAILTDIENQILEKRPILVLFDSIDQANKFSEFLITKKIKHQVLDDKQKEDEEYLISRAGRPGMVTIATNTAGRGTDIGLNLEALIAGGLHVILGFYPANVRVEQQGLGRAGRQGQPGTCRLILQINDEQISELISMKQLEELLQNKDDFIYKLHDLRSKRVAKESHYRVSKIQIDTIQHSVLKEFCNLLKHARNKITKLDCSELVTQLSHIKQAADVKQESSNSTIQFIQIQALNLISQQENGINVDWKSFLNTAKNVFFDMILQKWATFFDHLNDDDTHLDPELYKLQAFQRFHDFISTNLSSYLENPEKGFYHWLNELTGQSLDVTKKTESSYYAKWSSHINEMFNPTSIEYKKIDTKNDIALLTKALEQGDLNKLKQLVLETKIDVKTLKINGDPPLIIAAKNGHLDIVQWLLKTNHASIKDTSANGSTALLWAADCGHLPVVKWLIEEGGASNAEKTVVAENAVFLCAVYHGHLHVMQWLVKNSYSSIHEKNKNGVSALHYSALNGHDLCIEWLLQQGISIDDKNTAGNSALTIAASANQLNALRLLLHEGATLVADNDGDNALHVAAIKGHLTIVQRLIREAKGNVTARNNNGDTPLILAAAYGHLPLVKWLLKNGSTIYERNQDELTALIAACSNGQLTIVQWLLKHGGAKLDEQDANGCTVLMHAISNNHFTVVKYLLDNGANINAKNKAGFASIKFAKTEEMRSLLQEHSNKLKMTTPKVSLTQFSNWKPTFPKNSSVSANAEQKTVVNP